MKIKESILTLREMDMWSLVLFALYKIKDLPEYSALSELVYILDKDSVLKLCEYFGGLTITIPTIDELENLVCALVLYQHVNIDKMDYDKAITLLGEDSVNLRAVKASYNKICSILENYEFSARNA